MNVIELAKKYQDLLARWREPEERKILIERIRLKNKDIKSGHDELITEQKIALEYYRAWLQIPASETVPKLVQHPLMTKTDKSKIQVYLTEQKQAQAKYGGYFTAGTIAFYWMFLSRMARFQLFFNNREKSKVLNFTKKGFGMYAVFLGWVMVLNSHYEKKIPMGLKQMNLFKKYYISSDEKSY